MQTNDLTRRAFLAGAALATAAAAADAGTAPAPARPAAAGLDWPMYRHDARATATSTGRGAIRQPRVAWEHYLGAPTVPIATVRASGEPAAYDLDGDGRLERFVIDGSTIRVMDMDGAVLWTHTVQGRPLGGIVRVASVLPGCKGLQVISFSARMDTGQGEGYCFAFDQGAANGRLAWTTGPLEGQHSPTLVIDDVDGDGQLEIVTAPHYRVQIFNAQTGALKAEAKWDVGRNYGVLLTRPRQDAPQKDIYIVCDFVLHVDCIRFLDGKWTHAWGHKYFEPNTPQPKGRENYIRVGPNPVCDLDGDGRDEMAYMLIDARQDDMWRLRVREGVTGAVRADIPGIWVWSIADLDRDGRMEIAYTPTREKRPPTVCDLHIARYAGGHLNDIAVVRGVRPLLMEAHLPRHVHSIADEGLQDLLRTPIAASDPPAVFCASVDPRTGAEHEIRAFVLDAAAKDGVRWVWRYGRRGRRLNLTQAGPEDGRAMTASIRDLTAGVSLTVGPGGRVLETRPTGHIPGFGTTPIAVDVDGDGVNEIVVQTASGEIQAIRPGRTADAPPVVLWRVPGVAMSSGPGYAWNGALCPQAADVDGDGRPEIVFASELNGLAAVTVVDGAGRIKWRRAIEGCPWGGLQAGVDVWTFGRFAGRARGLDIYVGLHRRAKGSNEGWALRGDTGEVLWRQEGLISPETAMPFGGGIPAIADVNGDGVDDLVQMFYTVYGAVSGKTGQPIWPPELVTEKRVFGEWHAYSWPTLADLDGDGKLEVYLNSASHTCGGFAALRVDGAPMWAEFHNNDGGHRAFGPVADLDGDGRIEIAVPVIDGSIVCLDGATGKRRWRIDAGVTSDVIACDIDGDGAMELVFSARGEGIRAVRGRDGSSVWSVRAKGSPIAADIDGDGLLEIVAVGGDGVLRVIR